jgi:hypothetical protein
MILRSNIFMVCSFVLGHDITIASCPLMVEDSCFNTAWNLVRRISKSVQHIAHEFLLTKYIVF